MNRVELVRYLLKLLQKEKVDDVVIQLDEGDSSQIKFSNSKITTSKSWNLTTMGVFAAKDQRLFTSSLKTFSKSAVEELAKSIVQNLKSLPQNKNYRGIAEGKFSYKGVKNIYDPKIKDIDEELVDMARDGIHTITDAKQRADGVLDGGVSSSFLVNSNGCEVREDLSSLYFSVRSLASKRATGHNVSVSCMRNKFNYLDAARKAIDIAKKAKLPQKTLNGKFDVIFEPMAFAGFVEHMGDACSIFSVESGLSFFHDQLNKKVAGEHISIYDDGTLSNGLGSSMFDDEGHPTKKTALVKNGVLKSYLHNTSSATRYKTKSTGNAGLISPAPHNIVLSPGDYSKDELFSSVKKGIYVTNVWYTRFNNHSTGDFSTMPRDGVFYIENGEPVYTLKNSRISDNMLRILSSIDRMSKEVQQIKSWEVNIPTSLPYVVVKDVNFSKAHGS